MRSTLAATSGQLKLTAVTPCRSASRPGRSVLPGKKCSLLETPALRNVQPLTRKVHSSVPRTGIARSSHVCQAVESTVGHKLISKTEIPAFIARDDLIQQLLRWATIETGENCVRTYGLPLVVSEQIYKKVGDTDRLWGFKVSFFREGAKLGDLGFLFDDLTVQKHEWIDRDADGFPVVGGKPSDVKGKYFEIWKMDSNPVDEQLRTSIRAFCNALVSALTKYYSFGSVFSEEI